MAGGDLFVAELPKEQPGVPGGGGGMGF